jgi:hypothetical protein
LEFVLLGASVLPPEKAAALALVPERQCLSLGPALTMRLAATNMPVWGNCAILRDCGGS